MTRAGTLEVVGTGIAYVVMVVIETIDRACLLWERCRHYGDARELIDATA